MIIPYFLSNLGMGAGGDPVVYVTVDPLAAQQTACDDEDGDDACSCGLAAS